MTGSDQHMHVPRGCSDPVVSVEAFGQKQYSSVHKRTLSCVFDEVFLFNQRNMDKEDFEAAVGEPCTT